MFCINDTSYQTTEYLIIGIFEIFAHIFAVYATIRSVKIFLSITVFHENMNFMMACFLLQWFEAIIAKLIFLPYEYGYILIGDLKSTTSWYTTNPQQMVDIDDFDELLPLYVASVLLWHYIYTILICVIAIGIERTCATIYIHNYESTSRRQIPIILVLSCHMFSIPYSFFMANNRISFFFAFGILVFSLVTVSIMFLIVWRINVHLKFKMECSGTMYNYSLGQQFQIKENYKSMKLAKRLVATAVFFMGGSGALLIVLVFELVPNIQLFANHILMVSILLNPIAICPILMTCSKVWQRKFWNFIPMIFFSPSSEKSKPTINETDVYFRQLKNAWI